MEILRIVGFVSVVVLMIVMIRIAFMIRKANKLRESQLTRKNKKLLIMVAPPKARRKRISFKHNREPEKTHS